MLAEALRKSVLQTAVEGKLVPQSKDDEPASKLLESIKVEKEKLIKEGKIKKEKPIEPINEEEKPFCIPENWEWIRFGDICKLITKGASPKWQGINYVDNGLLFITSENVGIERLLFSNMKYVEKRFNTIQPRSILKKGDILTNIVGASIGRTAEYDLDTEANINQAVCLIRLVDMCVKPYILKYMNSYTAYKIMLSDIVDTARANISLTNISEFLIPLPPLAEQKRIVARVDEIMAKIDEFEAIEKELISTKSTFPEDMKKSLLQAAIQGKLTEQISTDSSVDELLEVIKAEKEQLIKEKKIKKEKPLEPISDDEIPFDIPKSWRWVRFSEIVNFSIGKTPPRKESQYWDGEYKWVSISDMVADGHIQNTCEKVSKESYDKVFRGAISPMGTLIMSFKLTIGKVSILDIEAFHNEAIISVFPYINPDNIMRDYLFKTLPFLSKMGDTKNAIKGNTLNSTSLSNLLIPLPPLKEQQRIVDILEELLPLCEDLIQEYN